MTLLHISLAVKRLIQAHKFIEKDHDGPKIWLVYLEMTATCQEHKPKKKKNKGSLESSKTDVLTFVWNAKIARVSI